MNEKFSEYLKDLPPELQEKAKDIKTNEELMEFLSDNDIELPEDALAAVAGGDGCEAHQSYEKGYVFPGECPDCGGDLVYFDNRNGTGGYQTTARCPKSKIMYYFTDPTYGRIWWKYTD